MSRLRLPALTLALLLGAACSPLPDPPPTVEACPGATVLEQPADPAEPGPWPVGARTLRPAGYQAEVWYPAEFNSDLPEDVTPKVYDIREHLPEDEQDKIPDEDTPFQHCDCYAGLPIDAEHGPYPVMLFFHGTGGFRTQSLTQMTHWASRGFVVVAAEHPGLKLSDLLTGNFGPDLETDGARILDELENPGGGLSFLAGLLDLDRLAVSGHSAGGSATAAFGDRAQVLIPMASGGVSPGAALRSTLVLGGETDGIVPFTSTRSGYDDSPAPKRLVGLSAAGHLAFSDLCAIGADQGGILQIALDHDVNVPQFLADLAVDGCEPEAMPPQEGWSIINAATSAVLEETLMCNEASAAAFASLPDAYPGIGAFAEQLN